MGAKESGYRCERIKPEVRGLVEDLLIVRIDEFCLKAYASRDTALAEKRRMTVPGESGMRAVV